MKQVSLVRESIVTPGKVQHVTGHLLIVQIITERLTYPGAVTFTKTVLQRGTNVYIGLLCHLNGKMLFEVLL